jgi:nitric oxide reductase NorQ protein
MNDIAQCSDPVVGHIDRTANDGSLTPEASAGFVKSVSVDSISRRALAYLEGGYPVHLSGPSGTGKTTLAFHIAAQLGRPTSLIHGNDEFGSSDLVGKEAGYTRTAVVDNYISSVLKTNESVNVNYSNNRLTTACTYGHTLIYDEFNRTRPEANNILLSIFEEGILTTPDNKRGGYLRVHPAFRAIFTSNPEEYAGVHKTQDALFDRLITIHVEPPDRETEIEIVASRSGIDIETVSPLVDFVRLLREAADGYHPTIRAGLMIARVLSAFEQPIDLDDTIVRDVCWDVVNSRQAELRVAGKPLSRDSADALLRELIHAAATAARGTRAA